MTDEVQLIYTTKGNVDLATLEYKQSWENHIETNVSLSVEDGTLVPKVTHGGYMVFIETYHTKDTNELVKENRHICLMNGFNLPNEQGLLT